MELFARAHGGMRPLHSFQKEADTALQSLLGSTLPQLDLPSVQRVFIKFIDILEQDLWRFTAGQVQLAETHLPVLNQVRKRQANLKMS